MKLTFLGTSSMVPTKQRNHSGMFLECEGEGILFDCGEGTQRQLRMADIAATKITRICISHWHGDHVLGLPGLISSIGQMDSTKVIHLYSIPGAKNYVYHMFKGFSNYTRVRLEVHEVVEGRVFETEKLLVECKPLVHSVPCYGYSVTEKDKLRIDKVYTKSIGLPDGPHLRTLSSGKDIEWEGKKVLSKDATYLQKGRKFTYIADTKLCDNAWRLAKGSTLLVTECTHSMGIEEKAEQYMHLTAPQGAEIAKKAGAKKLVLTHFSQRYTNVKPLVAEAKEIFANVDFADDFKVFEIKRPDEKASP